mgnify:CR=1 FL=1
MEESEENISEESSTISESTIQEEKTTTQETSSESISSEKPKTNPFTDFMVQAKPYLLSYILLVHCNLLYTRYYLH